MRLTVLEVVVTHVLSCVYLLHVHACNWQTLQSGDGGGGGGGVTLDQHYHNTNRRFAVSIQ